MTKVLAVPSRQFGTRPQAVKSAKVAQSKTGGEFCQEMLRLRKKTLCYNLPRGSFNLPRLFLST